MSEDSHNEMIAAQIADALAWSASYTGLALSDLAADDKRLPVIRRAAVVLTRDAYDGRGEVRQNITPPFPYSARLGQSARLVWRSKAMPPNKEIHELPDFGDAQKGDAVGQYLAMAGPGKYPLTLS